MCNTAKRSGVNGGAKYKAGRQRRRQFRSKKSLRARVTYADGWAVEKVRRFATPVQRSVNFRTVMCCYAAESEEREIKLRHRTLKYTEKYLKSIVGAEGDSYVVPPVTP